MYIPFGRTTTHTILGRAADFCPLCRSFQPFRILQVDTIRHFYTVPFGGRQSVGQSKVCESCGLLSSANLSNYRGLSTDPSSDLEQLIFETNPEIRRTFASRLMLEDRIQARKLTPGERATLLREPFEMAGEVLARRDLEGKLDGPSGIGCLATVALPVLAMILLPLFWKPGGETIELVAAILGGCGLAFCFIAIVTDARRHARRAIIPRLVASLRPLDPSAEEIDMILESLRQEKSPLADVLTPRDLTNRLMERWD